MSLFHLQLLSYAKHRNIEKTNGFDSSTESGYSVYVFGSDLSDYCIFDEVGPFRNLRILLWASFGALEIAVTFAAPLIMISVYHDFKRKMNDDKSRLRYYVWAMIVVMTLLIGPIYACNSLAISSGSYFVDVRVETYCLIGFLVALPILDVVWAVIAIAVFKFFEKAALNEKAICLDCYYVNCLCRHTDYYFIDSEENGTRTQLNNNELNEDQRNDHSDDDESEVRTRQHLNTRLKKYERKLMIKLVLKNGFHLASIAFITLFAQLTLFNSVFISFAVIAAPVESGSLLFLYLSSLFALISVLATGLKIAHKFQTSKQICIALILLFFLMVGVAGGVGVFVSFVYKYTLLIQEYRNSRGVIAFLGPIVPSVLATSVGGIFTTIIPCIKNPPPKDVPSPKDDRNKDDQKKDDPKDDRNKDDQKKDDPKDDGADKDDQKEDDSKGDGAAIKEESSAASLEATSPPSVGGEGSTEIEVLVDN